MTYELYERIPLAAQSMDADGRITSVNSAWCELFGYQKEDVLGRWFGDFLDAAQQDHFRAQYAGWICDGLPGGVELEIIRGDGDRLVVSPTGTVGRWVGEAFSQAHWFFTNLSEKKHYERLNRENQLLYHSLFQNNHEIILLIDPETGNIATANPAACAFYGYSLEEISRMNISAINILSPDEIRERMNHALATKQNVFSFKHRLASGEVRDVEVSSGPVEVGGYSFLYSLVHDVSQQKQAVEEAHRLQAAMHDRIVALSRPLAESSPLKFEDLFNIEDLQEIQDAFAKATGVASLITDPQGVPITRPSNFSHLCNSLIRKTDRGAKNCRISDATIGRSNSEGPTIQPCLSGGLLDAGASIQVGEHHLANWLVGQVWDTAADERKLLGYAGEIGIDLKTFYDAMAGVTRMPREQFENVSKALFVISKQLSKLALQNVQQARFIAECEQANHRLKRVNRLYAVLSKISQAAARAQTPDELYEMACHVLVETGEFRMAWIGLVDAESGCLAPQVWAGEEQGYLENFSDYFNPTLGKNGTVMRAASEGRLVYSNHFETDPMLEIWREEALRRGFHALASFPLKADDLLVGIMTVYSGEENYFDEKEISLLEEVCSTLSYALESMEKEKRRREAEAAVLESEEKYHRLFSSANDAIYVYPVMEDGQPGCFTEVNAVACEQLGYTQEEMLQLTPFEIHQMGDLPRINEILEQLHRKKKLIFETTHCTKTGQTVPVEVNARQFEHQGQTIALSVVRDISERKQAEEKIQKQMRRLSALRTIDVAINEQLSIPDVVDVVLDQVIDQLGVAAAAILLASPDQKVLHSCRGKGFKTAEALEFSIAVEGSLAGWAVVEKTAVKAAVLSSDPRFTRRDLLAAEGFQSYCAAPLISNGEVVGVLEVFSTGELNEDPEWNDFFGMLAGQAAIAVYDAQMYDGLLQSHQVLSQAYDATIEGWSRALDLRDHETEGHSQRVTQLSVRLAREMGCSEQDLRYIRWGALLHDIGKMGVPDKILMKPGKLDADEWALMARHPQYALDLLSSIDFLHPALDIPYCHHERWDGCGYPRGLKGEAIPLPARIFSIVDVWDALTSDRPYRPAWPKDQAVEYIRAAAGMYFDPEVVEYFTRILAEEVELHKR